MTWGLAISDAEANVLMYRSTVPNSEGLPSQTPDIEGKVWEHFEEVDLVKLAWADCIASGRDQKVVVTAKRNQMRCVLNLYSADPDTKIVSFSRWSPSSVLTEQECEVCFAAVAGQNPKEIASGLGISEVSVRNAKRSAMEKLDCHTPEQLGSHFSVLDAKSV